MKRSVWPAIQLTMYPPNEAPAAASFWGLMNVGSVFIGNSSSGILESSSFKIPYINIGMRQNGRLRSENVIDVNHDKAEIVRAIQTALYDETFKERVRNCRSPYGDGHAAERIVNILKNMDLSKKSIIKKITY